MSITNRALKSADKFALNAEYVEVTTSCLLLYIRGILRTQMVEIANDEILYNPDQP